MKVMGPRVLVKRIDAPAIKSSLIEVVEFEPELSNYALVLGVGQVRYKDGTNHPIPDVNVGDVVLLSKYSGAPIKITDNQGNPEEAVMVMYEDVMAVVEIS